MMYFPKDIFSLRRVYKYLIKYKLDYFIIGNGTNLVINDRYFDQVFINLKELKNTYFLKNNNILVLSGKSLPTLSLELAKKRYTKAEFLSVIPGTIGGAIYMNAGSFNQEISEIIQSVLVLDEEGELKLIDKEYCDFKYRSSIFRKRKMIIIGAILKLKKVSSKDEGISKIKYYQSSKKDIQPLNVKSAGSTFKNTSSVKAWEIVEKLGFRGKVNGGAKVNEKHTNFLVNHNHASFKDIYELMEEITKKAKEVYDISLECEWEIIK